MFDVERILAIPDQSIDYLQCGIAGRERSELRDRGFIRKDGIKAKDYMIRTIKKTDAAKAKAEKAIIKGDKKLGDGVKSSNTTIADKVKKLLEIKTENYRLKEHYNPQVSAQYAVDSVMSMIKNSSPEDQQAMLDMEMEDALTSRSNLLKSKSESKPVSTAKTLDSNTAVKAKKAISRQTKGGKVIKGESPNKRKETARLKVLKNSLQKKEARLQSKFDDYFDDVRSANGQPLNDKRNGQATLNRWDKKNNAIRSQVTEVEKTKNAIQREEAIIKEKKETRSKMPDYLASSIKRGELTQWKKHPHIMFVKGVDKGRIVFDEKTGKIAHAYWNDIPPEQRPIFRETYNQLKKVEMEREAVNPQETKSKSKRKNNTSKRG